MTLVGLWSHLIIASASFYYAPTGAVELEMVQDVVAFDITEGIHTGDPHHTDGW